MKNNNCSIYFPASLRQIGPLSLHKVQSLIDKYSGSFVYMLVERSLNTLTEDAFDENQDC